MLSHLSVSFSLTFGEPGFECGIQTTLSGFLDFFFSFMSSVLYFPYFCLQYSQADL